MLTALHNMCGLPLLETVGMFSPLVIRDVAAGSGEAVSRLRHEIPGPLAAANLCSSLFDGETDGVALNDDTNGAGVLSSRWRAFASSSRRDRGWSAAKL